LLDTLNKNHTALFLSTGKNLYTVTVKKLCSEFWSPFGLCWASGQFFLSNKDLKGRKLSKKAGAETLTTGCCRKFSHPTKIRSFRDHYTTESGRTWMIFFFLNQCIKMSDTSAPTSNIKDHDLLTFHPGDFREATKLHVSELLAALSAACGSCSVASQNEGQILEAWYTC